MKNYVWQSNYINFILEHSKNTHRGRCSTRSLGLLVVAVLLPTSVILIIASTKMPYEQAATVANSCILCADGAINLASSTRNRALRFCQVFLCYLPQFHFKCSISVTLILNYN
ncbi:hypothetical protein Zmor_024500 [Zophobas morio]|uniref:Uncharacterized protein n=1 Tax=Zophobas morio TaxID=2755281 RepID=A0AA38M837_9CUCU|nr:hypothetical protein Zmor_024500 [Zophobas morio]